MLVLTRQPNEKISIGEDIEVTIVDVRGDRVRVGIRAPRATQILRGELTIRSRARCQTLQDLARQA
jgi:carbon storage regulator